jgi:hypothetical protein
MQPTVDFWESAKQNASRSGQRSHLYGYQRVLPGRLPQRGINNLKKKKKKKKFEGDLYIFYFFKITI